MGKLVDAIILTIFVIVAQNLLSRSERNPCAHVHVVHTRTRFNLYLFLYVYETLVFHESMKATYGNAAAPPSYR